MNIYNRNRIIDDLQSALSPKRYRHTIRVEKTALSLASIYDANSHKCSIAALLHDCAKDIPKELQIKLCKDYHLEIEEPKKYNEVIHSFLGVEIAKREYNIQDSTVLNAIKYHTTGRPNMELIEKIIFVSDYIEPSRKSIPNIDEIRKLANIDIDQAILMIVNNNIEFLNTKCKKIYYLTRDTKEYYERVK